MRREWERRDGIPHLVEPVLDGVDRLETLAAELEVEPDEEQVEEYRAVSEGWSQRLGEP